MTAEDMIRAVLTGPGTAWRLSTSGPKVYQRQRQQQRHTVPLLDGHQVAELIRRLAEAAGLPSPVDPLTLDLEDLEASIRQATATRPPLEGAALERT